jgi:hypothetical protein
MKIIQQINAKPNPRLLKLMNIISRILKVGKEYILIDTSGFNDSSGKETDKIIMIKIMNFIDSKVK